MHAKFLQNAQARLICTRTRANFARQFMEPLGTGDSDINTKKVLVYLLRVFFTTPLVALFRTNFAFFLSQVRKDNKCIYVLRRVNLQLSRR